MNSSNPRHRAAYYVAVVLAASAVLALELELLHWFRRAHNPHDIVIYAGLAGALPGAFLGALFLRGADARAIGALCGAVVGLNVAWLLLLIAGVVQLFQLGIL